MCMFGKLDAASEWLQFDMHTCTLSPGTNKISQLHVASAFGGMKGDQPWINQYWISVWTHKQRLTRLTAGFVEQYEIYLDR